MLVREGLNFNFKKIVIELSKLTYATKVTKDAKVEEKNLNMFKVLKIIIFVFLFLSLEGPTNGPDGAFSTPKDLGEEFNNQSNLSKSFIIQN